MPESEKTKRLKVMMSSLDARLSEFLQRRLSPADFVVVEAQHGAHFFETARREHPEIAVIDCTPERAEASQLEIALLKDIRPEVRIIAISRRSTEEDAKVVEQGVFYYTTEPSGEELIQVIEAAARSMFLKGRDSKRALDSPKEERDEAKRK